MATPGASRHARGLLMHLGHVTLRLMRRYRHGVFKLGQRANYSLLTNDNVVESKKGLAINIGSVSMFSDFCFVFLHKHLELFSVWVVRYYGIYR